MVLTSHDKLGDTGTQTGWYLPEAAHPWEVFNECGVEMTWASPKGGLAPVDEGSVKSYEEDKVSKKFLKTDAYKTTKKLSDVDPSDFDAVFVVGGYGVMWDLVDNERLKGLVRNIWEDEGIVSGVCHGPAALVGITLKDGKSLSKDKRVACFSDDEEAALNRSSIVPETCEKAFKGVGAKYTSRKPWSVHVVEDGRLITGQNPMSAKATAEAVCKALLLKVVQQLGKVESVEGVSEAPASPGAMMPALVGAVLMGVAAMATVRVLRNRRITAEEGAELIDEEEGVFE